MKRPPRGNLEHPAARLPLQLLAALLHGAQLERAVRRSRRLPRGEHGELLELRAQRGDAVAQIDAPLHQPRFPRFLERQKSLFGQLRQRLPTQSVQPEHARAAVQTRQSPRGRVRPQRGRLEQHVAREGLHRGVQRQETPVQNRGIRQQRRRAARRRAERRGRMPRHEVRHQRLGLLPSNRGNVETWSGRGGPAVMERETRFTSTRSSSTVNCAARSRTAGSRACGRRRSSRVSAGFPRGTAFFAEFLAESWAESSASGAKKAAKKAA